MAEQSDTTNLSSVPSSKPLEDAQVLQAVAKWHLARAELKAEYASRDLQIAADAITARIGCWSFATSYARPKTICLVIQR